MPAAASRTSGPGTITLPPGPDPTDERRRYRRTAAVARIAP